MAVVVLEALALQGGAAGRGTEEEAPAAGVAEGARNGLHSVFVGLMFLLAIFLAAFAGIVPASATAPALPAA